MLCHHFSYQLPCLDCISTEILLTPIWPVDTNFRKYILNESAFKYCQTHFKKFFKVLSIFFGHIFECSLYLKNGENNRVSRQCMSGFAMTHPITQYSSKCLHSIISTDLSQQNENVMYVVHYHRKIWNPLKKLSVV